MAIDTSALPEGGQKSIGNTKDAVGVSVSLMSEHVTISHKAVIDDAYRVIGNTKDAVGVINDSFVADGDMLAHQANAVARARGTGSSVIQNGGTNFSDEVINAVLDSAPKFQRYMGMNEKTIQAMAENDPSLQRDGTFTGNNANFTGYYLEDAAKFVIPQMTPFGNQTPRDSIPGIDTINWRAVTDYFGGTGPTVAGGVIQQFGTPNKLAYSFVN